MYYVYREQLVGRGFKTLLSLQQGDTTDRNTHGDIVASQQQQTSWPVVQEISTRLSGHYVNESMTVLTYDGNSKNEVLEKAFQKTFYYWNDGYPNSWKKLPLRRRRNGSLAISGISQKRATKAVIYNRVPKTGSRVILKLVQRLAQNNKFYVISSVVYNRNSIANFKKRQQFVEAVGHIKTPFFMDRHLHFLDFNEFNVTQPTYINIVRDPLKRMISAYNFNRFGDGTNNNYFEHFAGDNKLSLDDCIIGAERECTENAAFITIPFFCGQDNRCKKPSDWSLSRAMANVERYYLAVGLTEEIDNTLRVFEKLLPDFFKGAAKLFTESTNSKTATKYRYTPSPQAGEIMRKRLRYEYTFYYYIKERFDKLKTKLQI